MILASHNSLTYLKPKYWIMNLFKWFYRCQTKTIEEQYLAGVRYFDFRICFNKFGIPKFRHGLTEFKTDGKELFNILEYLNQYKDIVIRVVLEKVKDSTDYDLFRMLCQEIQEKYVNIKFCCGEYKKTKEVIYDFKTTIEIPIYEKYSSVIGSKLNDIYPYGFAKKHNQDYINQYKEQNCYLMLDFI